jgi:hypothetical protein
MEATSAGLKAALSGTRISTTGYKVESCEYPLRHLSASVIG